MQGEAVKLFVSQVLTLLNATQTKTHHTMGLAGHSHWAGIPNVAFLFYLGVPTELPNLLFKDQNKPAQSQTMLSHGCLWLPWETLMPPTCLSVVLLAILQEIPESLASFPRLPTPQCTAGRFSWSQQASNTLWVSPLKVGICSLSLVTFSLTWESIKIWLILRANKDLVWEPIKTYFNLRVNKASHPSEIPTSFW